MDGDKHCIALLENNLGHLMFFYSHVFNCKKEF